MAARAPAFSNCNNAIHQAGPGARFGFQREICTDRYHISVHNKKLLVAQTGVVYLCHTVQYKYLNYM